MEMDDVGTLFYTLIYTEDENGWYGEISDEQGRDKGWTETFGTKEEAEVASRDKIVAEGYAPQLLKVIR
jgi:hypothetical protein